MSYSTHFVKLTDVQTLVVLNALRLLIQDKDINEDDKVIAENLKLYINGVVLLDKTPKAETSLNNKCGSCKWAKPRRTTYVDCTCPDKKPNWFARTAKACKHYEKETR